MNVIDSITFKKGSSINPFFNVSNFNVSTLGGVFNFSNDFGKLRVRLTKDLLFISSGDICSAYLTTGCAILSAENNNSMFISSLSLLDQPSERDCHYDSGYLEIAINDTIYVVEISDGRLRVNTIEYDKIMFEPFAANVVLLSATEI